MDNVSRACDYCLGVAVGSLFIWGEDVHFCEQHRKNAQWELDAYLDQQKVLEDLSQFKKDQKGKNAKSQIQNRTK